MTNQALSPDDQTTSDIFRYCPRCGADLKLENRDDQAVPVCRDADCRFELWPCMYPTVSAVIENEVGEVLLLRRANEPERGKLDTPGGFMRYGELPEAALVRETREEVGVTVTVTEVLGFALDHYAYKDQPQLNLALGFTARIVDGEPRVASGAEVASVTWTDPAAVSFGELAFECNRKFLEVLLERRRTVGA